jgi:hypothetical protein
VRANKVVAPGAAALGAVVHGAVDELAHCPLREHHAVLAAAVHLATFETDICTKSKGGTRLLNISNNAVVHISSSVIYTTHANCGL